MKSIKRIVAVVLVVLSMMSVMAVYASAANTADTSGSVSISGSSWAYGPYRAKENSTATYLYISSAPSSSARVRVMGYNSGGSSTNLTVANGSLVSYVTCRVGVKYSVHNNVFERGYTYAGLGFQNVSSGSGTLNYTWSPDSAYSYTDAT